MVPPYFESPFVPVFSNSTVRSMLNQWQHWLSSLHPNEILAIFGGLLLTDTPRYVISKIVMVVGEVLLQPFRWLSGKQKRPAFDHVPSVGILLAGYNEGETIGATLESIWGTYPRLHIVVIDDGSEDQTYKIARRFAARHSGVTVVRRSPRGGKSSALNMAMQLTQAEIVMTVDADSALSPTAIWEIVQPFKDPRVGAVSGNILVRNYDASLVSMLQAYEYLNCILVGRILSARLGILSISSGALAAFRRSAVMRCRGWDVGPGEDADITMKLRKADYKIEFAPYSHCYTDAPTTWKVLLKQRLRWDRSLLRFKCRKHLHMANPFLGQFRVGNFVHIMDVWFHNIFCTYALWFYLLCLLIVFPSHLPFVFLTTYTAYALFAMVQSLTVLYYTDNVKRDLVICLFFPFAPIYYGYLGIARTLALTSELIWRHSYQDNYVPARVREATWKW